MAATNSTGTTQLSADHLIHRLDFIAGHALCVREALKSQNTCETQAAERVLMTIENLLHDLKCEIDPSLKDEVTA